VAKDGLNGPGFGEEGEDAQVGAAVGALEGEDLLGAAQGDDAGAEPGVGRQHAVVAVAVDAGWRDEASEDGEEPERSAGRRRQVEGREDEDGAAIERGSGQVIEDLAHAGPGCGS
jgi:hypothetical protein